ncbi:MAG: hypothetical protein R6X08_11720 [Desulfosalsimonadaceae bacterium]
MADAYFYLWEFAVSLTIIVLAAAFLINERLNKALQSLPEGERQTKQARLKTYTLMGLGGYSILGGLAWLICVAPRDILVSPALYGFHVKIPGAAAALVGLFLLVSARKKQG